MKTCPTEYYTVHGFYDSLFWSRNDQKMYNHQQHICIGKLSFCSLRSNKDKYKPKWENERKREREKPTRKMGFYFNFSHKSIYRFLCLFRTKDSHLHIDSASHFFHFACDAIRFIHFAVGKITRTEKLVTEYWLLLLLLSLFWLS